MNIFALAVFFLLCACNLAPKYAPPPTPTPETWKADASVKNAAPPVCLWWEVFQDPILNELEMQAIAYNNNLYVALEKVIEARSVAGVNQSYLYPHVNLNPSYSDTGQLFQIFLPGAILPILPAGTTITPFRIHQYQYVLPLNLNYEVDLWGKVRNQYYYALHSAEAQVADFYGSLLTLTADVASAYFQARALDAEIDLLKETIAVYRKEVALTSSRYNKGLVNLTDVTNAEYDYAGAEASLQDTERLRCQQENIIAVLIGVPPAYFSLERNPLLAPPPEIPPGSPATILLQRPDVAEAERNLAAENASIGVARAAFFPSLVLTGALGYNSPTLQDFLKWISRYWALGANISQTVFDADKNAYNLDAAWATFNQASGTYQQVVLTAFQEVENSLNDVEKQAKQYEYLVKAADAVGHTTRLSRERYEKGITNYLEVVYNERNALTARTQAIQVLGVRYVSTIQLIKSLGGSWEAARLTPAAS